MDALREAVEKQRFVQNFATRAEPLLQLLKKSRRYVWREEQQKAFEVLKKASTAVPILARREFESPFHLQTNASSIGLGAVLTQVLGGEERVIAYASRTMIAAERNYTVTEQECLAVVWAVKKFRAYLEGYHFEVITDHSSLRCLYGLKDPSGRLARWALQLLQFDFTITHRKGALHHVPNAVSRMYEPDPVNVSNFAETDDP